MADGTSIEWCDATVNAISGCLPASPGCTNCFASTAGARRRPHHPVNGLTRPAKPDDPASHHVWTGATRLNKEWLVKPLRWARPRRIFWNAHGDPWFEAVPYEWVDRELAIAALTPHHIHMLLTKRTGRMRRYFAMPGTPERILAAAKALPAPHGRLPDRWQWPLPNVWLGTSVEDQERAAQRIPDLLAVPAAVRFLSCEPLLEQVNLTEWMEPAGLDTTLGLSNPGLDWIIVGGESGPRARPMHPDWVSSIRDQCAAAGVPFFFKQWGEWAAVGPHNRDMLISAQGSVEHPRYEITRLRSNTSPGATILTRVGKRRAGRLLDGIEHSAFPEVRHGL